MKTGYGIKRGATLYSFQEAYFFRQLDLEDCIAALADMGGEMIELIPDQMVHEFPNVSNAFIDRWHGWMKRYDMTPVCMDDFVETNLYRDHRISEDEQVERFIKSAKLARRLGCSILREQFALGNPLMTTNLIRRCLPYAEEYGVSIGMEVHAPNYLNNPEIDDYMELIHRVNDPLKLSIIPDFSIFMHSIPKIVNDFYARNGVREEIIQRTGEAYQDGRPLARALDEIHKLVPDEEEIYYVRQMYGIHCNRPIAELKDHAKYISHIHAKFFEVNEQYLDESIDVEAIIRMLEAIGYQGAVCSEYEGNRYIHDAGQCDCIEQMRRHQILLKNVIGH